MEMEPSSKVVSSGGAGFGGSLMDAASDNKMEPMEVECASEHNNGISSTRPTAQVFHRPHPLQRSQHACDLWCNVLCAHIQYYPKIAAAICVIVFGLSLTWIVPLMKPAVTRNRLSYDYTQIDMEYNFRAAQMDHWCLFGGDTACRCDDFSEPIPREEYGGWLEAHQANIALVDDPDVAWADYDVVFVGDDTVEAWNGRQGNMPMHQYGKQIQTIFAQNFRRNDEQQNTANYQGMALGIAGDSASNVLWRLQHGEMPVDWSPGVFWLSLGGTDLATGGCSEAAVVLGILRVAEEIAYHHPDSPVVIQGLLPRTRHADGSLSMHHHKFFGGSLKAHSVAQARREFFLWPSIQNINKELAAFCKIHEQFIFVDVSQLFLGSLGNAHYKSQDEQIITSLMPDYAHLSAEGHAVLARAIVQELDSIMQHDNEENAIMQGGE